MGVNLETQELKTLLGNARCATPQNRHNKPIFVAISRENNKFRVVG